MRALVTSALVVLIVVFVVTIYVSDDRSGPTLSTDQGTDAEGARESPAPAVTRPATSESSPILEALSSPVAQDEDPRTWKYAHLFKGLDAESPGPGWASEAASTIDDTLRSSGGYIRDVEVRCTSAGCGAIILYQSQLFALGKSVAEDTLLSQAERLEDLQAAILLAYPDLKSYRGLMLAEISREPIGSENPEEHFGTMVFFSVEP